MVDVNFEVKHVNMYLCIHKYNNIFGSMLR